MAVNVIRYTAGDEIGWGVLEGDEVRRLDVDAPTTAAFLRHSAQVRSGGLRTDVVAARGSVRVLSPITGEGRFVCQAVNYRSHMRETGFDPETSPFNVFFGKAPSSIAPPDTDIVCPAEVEYLDYEAEIGLVLARDVGGPVTIGDADLADHVAALVAVNDVSARDLQLAETQFYRAKSYRTFGPTGPHLTLVDSTDLARFGELRLRLTVNGDVRQDSLASDMIHGPAATLTELSTVQDWAPGDLLATGTPGGCALEVPRAPLRALALAMSPKRRLEVVRRSAARNPRRLRPGDVVEVHIGTDDGAIDLGRQRTRVTTPYG